MTVAEKDIPPVAITITEPDDGERLRRCSATKFALHKDSISEEREPSGSSGEETPT